MYWADLNTVKRSFAKINSRVFEKQLSYHYIDHIYIQDIEGYYGWCEKAETGEVIIGLAETYQSKKEFESTLCHEMIHLWQVLTGNTIGHSKTFKRFASIAKKQGFVV